MNDCIKSCRKQFIAVFDLAGEEDDGDSGCMKTCRPEYAERNFACQCLPVGFAFTGDDETASPHPFRKADGFQDGFDPGMHFRTQTHRERGADPAGCAGTGKPVRIDSILPFPGFCLATEPPLQLGDTRCVRPFLGTEYGRCSGRSGQGDIDIIEGMDAKAVGKGREGLQETGTAVHDCRSAETDPDFFYSLLDSILYQFTCTDG